MKTILETDSEFFCDIQAPCFKNLHAGEVEIVRASRTQVLFRRGENLTKQGAFASYILFVVHGMAKQYVEGNNTRNYNLRIIIPGEFVGLSALFSGNLFDYSSIALTDCQAYLIENDAITRLLKQNALFAYGMIKRYCEQNTNLLKTIGSLVFRQMNGRLAEALLYLDGLNDNGERVFQYLTRRDIADFAGISTESTVKLLKNFEKDGLITLNDKDIRILKPESLKEISRLG